MMPSYLTDPQWDGLARRFSLFRHDNVHQCLKDVSVADLLNEEKCVQYLDWLGDYIGSPSRRVTASTLAKRYAHIAASPVLYAMTVYNKGLDLSLEHTRLGSAAEQGEGAGATKLPLLRLSACVITEPPHGQRNEWREMALRKLFAEHLSPLYHALSAAARVPMAILWENAVVRIAPLFEDALENAVDESAAIRIRDDFHFIAHESSGELFGERRNPLCRFVPPVGEAADSASDSGRPGRRLRQTCCFYYEISAEYCRLCPLPRQSCH